MDTPTQSQRRTRRQWPSEISYYLLSLLTNRHKYGKGGDNGLRKKQWVGIATALNERWNTAYDWDQTRNHYRVWKLRLRTLADLQKDSGMGWNEVEHRFCAGQQRWANLKKKEQRYWKNHPVLPIHLETLLWFGYEIATGKDAVHPSEMPDGSYKDCHTPEVPADDDMYDMDGDDCAPATEVSSSHIVSNACSRGRPRSGSSSTQQSKKKKGIVDEIISPLKNMAAALQTMAMANSDREFAREVNEAVREMDGCDKQQKTRASLYLLHHRMEAYSILKCSKRGKGGYVGRVYEEELNP